MRRPLLLTILVAAVATACTTSTTGGSPVTTSAAAPASGLAPAITAPQLDLMAQKQNPCGIIPTPVRDQYGIAGAGTPNANGVTGPNCSFTRRADADPVVTTGVNVKSGGLEGLYQRRSNFQVFTPTTVDGYPAVYLQPQQDPTGCSLNVAVNDAELVYVDLTVGDPAPADPAAACTVTTDIATTTITSLAK